LTKGTGVHKDRLASFELALRDAKMRNITLLAYQAFYLPIANLFPKRKVLQN
jgi:arginine decarboxylase